MFTSKSIVHNKYSQCWYKHVLWAELWAELWVTFKSVTIAAIFTIKIVRNIPPLEAYIKPFVKPFVTCTYFGRTVRSSSESLESSIMAKSWIRVDSLFLIHCSSTLWLTLLASSLLSSLLTGFLVSSSWKAAFSPPLSFCVPLPVTVLPFAVSSVLSL